MFKLKYILPAAALVVTTSCSDFLEEQVPQGTLSQEQALQVKNTEAMVVAAYAGLTTIEDINASFSLWNYDVRSDDAYKGGANEGDGDVFHKIETGNGILPSDWSINGGEGIWARLYNFISRTNTALALLNSADEAIFPPKNTRIAEMKFLRAYGHFQLKRLFGNIPFVLNENLKADDYYNISNVEFDNDEGWQLLAKELEEAYNVLPEKQADKGRPTKAACAALLAKVYLYKAYRKNPGKNTFSGEVNKEDLLKVIEFTAPSIYENYDLEADFHNNFRPEEEFENGIESIWAVQYSFNDGSVNGNRNFGCALMAPNVEGATTGGHDFYKPSQNLVNAFRTDHNGLPMDNFNAQNYDVTSDNVDPRLFHTVGMVGFPYMFNPNFIQQKDWARNASGLYGYNVCLKYNVDLGYVGKDTYIKKCGWCWATSMNRQVLRLADVKLMRAEALAQLNLNMYEVWEIIKSIRERAAASTNLMLDYSKKYGVKFKVGMYERGAINTKETALKAVKFERRLEMAMEAERFFDLVRWGDAKTVLDQFYAADPTGLYKNSNFTENKLEYMPIPFNEIQSSNNLYKQNPGY